MLYLYDDDHYNHKNFVIGNDYGLQSHMTDVNWHRPEMTEDL